MMMMMWGMRVVVVARAGMMASGLLGCAQRVCTRVTVRGLRTQRTLQRSVGSDSFNASAVPGVLSVASANVARRAHPILAVSSAAVWRSKWTLASSLVQPVACQEPRQAPLRSVLPSRKKASGKDGRTLDWKLLWELLRPDIFLLAAAVVAALTVAYVNIQVPILLGSLVNAITSSGGDVSSMQNSAVSIVGAYVTQTLFTAMYITLLGVVGEKFAERVRLRLFESIMRQDIAFFDQRQSGEIVNRLTTDVQEFKSSFKQVVSVGLRNITQAVGSLVSMYMVSPTLTGYLIVVVPTVIAVGTALGSSLRRMSRESHEAADKTTSYATEVIGNMRTVRGFGMESREVAEFNHWTSECRRLASKLAFGIGVFTGGSHLFLNGVVLGVIYYGGVLMSRDEMTAGDLMRFLVSSQTIQRALSNTSVLFGQVVRGMGAGSRVFEYIKHNSYIPLTGGLKPHQLEGGIEFADVTFAYPTRPEQQVLKRFHLQIPAGKMVALCGPSGAGKSTVASLIERFYDPSEGTVLLDGLPLSDYDPTYIRQQAIGYINQEPVLFATTVFENIRYGRPDATPDEVYEAARQANAHQFISSFPEGYDTVLGERGVTVSGGQKQRIAIARAILKNPRILILDEATSALDAESEKLVQAALDRLTAGRTVLVIAHRLSTIQAADQIAVVLGGRVVEQGTHKQLIRAKGVYADLVRHQISGEGGYVV
ncbi:multidrug resistance protein 1 [Salpingoeca rosetta]|uniref:Mitochondrial potassium channel ATP-binding subunit n=1 Tax=Salpingoeca rosetta (strain ATCC 50818 / BSB-021) TaxID=946362 RepID=F2U730_SALR5|nr:multidrug resistance protein 1 [Salpingoeca rosetta]EGD83662.1 multidrug resistance protein 1 [Salpingoeca rosetta]|eukprot:XP_004995166.1 multidrug resistance protein 1 [Salpingoeca rosetta]